MQQSAKDIGPMPTPSEQRCQPQQYRSDGPGDHAGAARLIPRAHGSQELQHSRTGRSRPTSGHRRRAGHSTAQGTKLAPPTPHGDPAGRPASGIADAGQGAPVRASLHRRAGARHRRQRGDVRRHRDGAAGAARLPGLEPAGDGADGAGGERHAHRQLPARLLPPAREEPQLRRRGGPLRAAAEPHGRAGAGTRAGPPRHRQSVAPLGSGARVRPRLLGR